MGLEPLYDGVTDDFGHWLAGFFAGEGSFTGPTGRW
jgi:hypothetical protein